MWKLSATVTLLSLLWATVQAGQNSVYSQYSITPSNQVSSYHYPAPPHSQQLNEISVRPITSSQVGYVPQHSADGAAQTYHNQYQGNYYARSNSQNSVITRQFASPALDNAAFNLALTNQGYTAVNAALTTSSRSSKTASQTVAASSPPSSPSAKSSPSSQLAITSLNVKLPLPIGVTPLNIGPLPLQGGAPYNSIPNGVTSYGTLYPQRKRR